MSELLAALQPAVQYFWDTRSAASLRQRRGPAVDMGGRRAVTSGGHLDGFLDVIESIVIETAQVSVLDIKRGRRVPVLPGFFRPEKAWDLVILKDTQVAAVIELKAQVGPSFGNNFNNRAEEALGNADDFWTAYRESAFGEQPPPWLGYLFLLEDHPKARHPVRLQEPIRPVLPVFRNTSYAERYAILLRRMIRERRYSATTLLLSAKPNGEKATLTEPVPGLGITPWIQSLQGHLSGFATGGSAGV